MFGIELGYALRVSRLEIWLTIDMFSNTDWELIGHRTVYLMIFITHTTHTHTRARKCTKQNIMRVYIII